jgi:hypothetical protein
LETDLDIPTSLAVPPVQGSTLALAKSQVGFMKLFAGPLFQSIADVMPEMSFGINEVNNNLERWSYMITDCTENGDRPFLLANLKSEAMVPPRKSGANSANSKTIEKAESKVWEKNNQQGTNGGVPVIPESASNGEYNSNSTRIRKASQQYQEQGTPDLLGLGSYGKEQTKSPRPSENMSKSPQLLPQVNGNGTIEGGGDGKSTSSTSPFVTMFTFLTRFPKRFCG